MSTNRRTHREHPQAGARPETEAATHRDAVAEFASGAFRPRELHRRIYVWRSQKLPGAIPGRPTARVFNLLRERLKPICHRTLRRQVTTYVPYTRRYPIVEEFTPEDGEDKLYDLVSEYLRRDNLQALPASQRSLMTLVLRKLLASSTFAIAGALTSISRRLQSKLDDDAALGSAEEDLADDGTQVLDETKDEWTEDDKPEPLTAADRKAIEAEIADLTGFAKLATSIDQNGKGKALLKALGVAFAKAEELGAVKKAIIFTGSRRTQVYLLRVLADSPYAQGIVLFNGTNTDERPKEIYAAWFAQHQGSDRVPGPSPPICGQRWWIISATTAAS